MLSCFAFPIPLELPSLICIQIQQPLSVKFINFPVTTLQSFDPCTHPTILVSVGFNKDLSMVNGNCS